MKIKIWSFDSHYMMKCSCQKFSYGWRVNTPLQEDGELSDRIFRLKNLVNKMMEERDENR